MSVSRGTVALAGERCVPDPHGRREPGGGGGAVAGAGRGETEGGRSEERLLIYVFLSNTEGSSRSSRHTRCQLGSGLASRPPRSVPNPARRTRPPCPASCSRGCRRPKEGRAVRLCTCPPPSTFGPCATCPLPCTQVAQTASRLRHQQQLPPRGRLERPQPARPPQPASLV